jgi:3'-phosphoadenosine 5'-phosphosulfate sulfotransferase (PAPS reductase)/FAD synthetase
MNDQKPYYPPCFALVSGGKDSLSTAQVLADADRLLGCVALSTGISTPDWRDFVIDTCRARGWPLEFHHTDQSYDDLVREYGFPGPGRHPKFMDRLKGRAVREFKRKHPNGILASGTRRDESGRRKVMAKPFGVWEGVPILAPIYDWTTDETWEFFNANGFTRAPAYQTLMVSGDCLCGAFAVQGEAQALRLCYPQIADRFDAIGREIKDAFPKRCQWGWGWQEKRGSKSAREAALCQECGDNADLFADCILSGD